MKVKKIFPFLFVLSNFFLLSAHSMEAFNEGEEFRRTKSDSPVFLRYSKKIIIINYGLNVVRPGFEIYTYHSEKEKRERIGYVTYEFSESEDIVEIAWVNINDNFQNKGYATKALETLISLMKKKRASHFLNRANCFLTVGESRKAMLKVAEKLGFKTSNLLFCPPELQGFILPLSDCPSDEKAP